ncbi:MAG: PTS sugar transporter subunit IIA, partial [Fidelibacterota bacterium]
NVLSTGLKNGIAIPHAKSSGVENLTVAFGIKRNGVDFNSSDGRPSQFIPLVISPRKTSVPHINILAELVKKLSEKEIREKILSAESREEIYKILCQ